MAAHSEVKFNLVQNARDSLIQAVDVLADPESVSPAVERSAIFKRSILCIAHCVELLLKERIRRIHPAFVWEKVDQYPSLEARTITVDTTLHRLERIGNIKLQDGDKKAILSLKKMRNAIEHYEFSISRREADVVIGRVISFAFSFSKHELGIDMEREFRKDDTWRQLIYESYEFAKTHGDRVSSQLWQTGCVADECAECGQETLNLFDETCAFCGHIRLNEEED